MNICASANIHLNMHQTREPDAANAVRKACAHIDAESRNQFVVKAAEIGANVTLAARLPSTHSAKASSVLASVRPTSITASS